MPWKEATPMSLRFSFVQLALEPGANIRALCRQFAISPRTGYKWLQRFDQGGLDALQDLPRRPRVSPRRVSNEVELAILSVRDAHPAWGARKIQRRLPEALGDVVPCPSTITEVLRRNGRLSAEESAKHKPFRRFEKAAPNELWQMDFKGHFSVGRGRCHPLTVLDDHSRFLVGLRACKNERQGTVQASLVDMFREYGLPQRMLTDNGAPWGVDEQHRYTALSAWLIQHGVSISHTGSRHPQTIGKDERLHRTLKAEVIQGHVFLDLEDCQREFDAWRNVYNQERPHEAIDMEVPQSRYCPSPRSFPETPPKVEYESNDSVRKVQSRGEISFRNHLYPVGQAFVGFSVALRPTSEDGVYDVYFCHQKITQIDLHDDGS